MQIEPNEINFRMSVKAVTDIFQTEGSETRNGVPTAYIKKREEIVDDKIGTYPYYTGNGHRGLMHRVIADIVLNKAEEKGINIEGEITDFHFLTAGGGSNYQSQALSVELEARRLNPIISVFGVSLAVEGKMMNSNLNPTNKMYRVKEGSDTMRSRLIGYETFTKKDDVTGEIGRRYLSEDEIDEYLEDVADVQEARSKERDSKEKGTKKLSIQAFNAREVLKEGTELVGYIASKDNFTDIEKGMLLVTLEGMMKRRLGGGSNNFKGVVTYKITTEVYGGVRDVMSSKTNDANLGNPIITTNYDKDEKRCIKAFENWLENITEDEVFISRLLTEK
jgi:CRISPR type IV-associated protein Csf2